MVRDTAAHSLLPAQKPKEIGKKRKGAQCNSAKKIRKDMVKEARSNEELVEDEVQIDKEISTATINASSMEDEPRKYEDVLPGMWVVVRYEEERFLGKVKHKKCGEYYVRCLDKPFGINIPQHEPDGVYYSEVFQTDIIPENKQIIKGQKENTRILLGVLNFIKIANLHIILFSIYKNYNYKCLVSFVCLCQSQSVCLVVL